MPTTDEALSCEDTLTQTQKVEAIGRLAGHVAHDINDILTVIGGYANLLLNSGNCPAEMQEPLRQIFLAGSRATDLTQRLMSSGAADPGGGCADVSGDGAGETILLVEDEGSVREFAAAVLRRCGYRVLQAASGGDALDVWKWHSRRITLLFTDLVMHDDMTGLELARRLRAEKPSLKVICTSGYGGDSMEGDPAPPEGVRFLQKPYKPQSLANAVGELLAGAEKP
jgi:CheY-like chemotaxis protein